MNKAIYYLDLGFKPLNELFLTMKTLHKLRKLYGDNHLNNKNYQKYYLHYIRTLLYPNLNNDVINIILSFLPYQHITAIYKEHDGLLNNLDPRNYVIINNLCVGMLRRISKFYRKLEQEYDEDCYYCVIKNDRYQHWFNEKCKTLGIGTIRLDRFIREFYKEYYTDEAKAMDKYGIGEARVRADIENGRLD